MVKGIVGLCLALNLKTTYTDVKWTVIWPPNFTTKDVSFTTNFYTGVASTCYQLKRFISNTVCCAGTIIVEKLLSKHILTNVLTLTGFFKWYFHITYSAL